MENIFITGAGGFVGKHTVEYFKSNYQFKIFDKDESILIHSDIVVHLAGKAHDLKNVSDASEYYTVNTELTKKLFDAFLLSDAKIFITLSSVKAVADTLDSALTEDYIPNPTTHYGKSKLLAEQYILSKHIPKGKRVYVLRPCMIYGPENKGNFNLLNKIVKWGIPWPLGAFENKRSFCSIYNLMFVMQELIDNNKIPSGVYNIADSETISTNELVKTISNSLSKNILIVKLPKFIISMIAKIGDILKLPLNSERLKKLTETYIVSNEKLLLAIEKPLPFSLNDGLVKTFETHKKFKHKRL